MLINLYSRCQARKSLPCGGGVLDQPAWIMDAFDVIDHTRTDFQRKESERQRDEEIKSKLSEGLNCGR